MHHSFVVVGSGFVVADAAAVLVDPGEGSLHRPDPGPDVESGAAGDAFDDVNPTGDDLVRPADQPAGVAFVGPYQPDRERTRPADAPVAGTRRRDRGIDAAVTTTASSSPLTSTAMWRLRPFVFLPPSHPRVDRCTVSAAGTVWSR